MKKSDLHIEADFAKLNNHEVLELLASLFEQIKRLEEEAKVDQELKDLEEAAKNYKFENYGRDISILRSRLRVLRIHAKSRNIKLSEEVYGQG